VGCAAYNEELLETSAKTWTSSYSVSEKRIQRANTINNNNNNNKLNTKHETLTRTQRNTTLYGLWPLHDFSLDLLWTLMFAEYRPLLVLLRLFDHARHRLETLFGHCDGSSRVGSNLVIAARSVAQLLATPQERRL
jgi:hypothetical protein